jgi:hypothetical protein
LTQYNHHRPPRTYSRERVVLCKLLPQHIQHTVFPLSTNIQRTVACVREKTLNYIDSDDMVDKKYVSSDSTGWLCAHPLCTVQLPTHSALYRHIVLFTLPSHTLPSPNSGQHNNCNQFGLEGIIIGLNTIL